MGCRVIYADGSTLGGVACVVDGERKPIKKIPLMDSEEAEWEGLLYALSFCERGETVRIYLDALKVVTAWNNYRSADPKSREYMMGVRDLCDRLGLSAVVAWTPRKYNLAGKILEKHR